MTAKKSINSEHFDFHLSAFDKHSTERSLFYISNASLQTLWTRKGHVVIINSDLDFQINRTIVLCVHCLQVKSRDKV